jgi:uncharacterized protein YbjT (DUF2867 family)
MTAPAACRIAVAGGTGVVGRHVVEALRRDGHEPVVLARSRGVDVTTGRGLDQALSGVWAVVDVTNRATLRRTAAVAFFEAATRHLLEASRRAGVGHLVVLSVVGADRVPSGYYAGKLRQEELALGGDVPATVLRATQLHEFAGQVLDRSTVGPLGLVPRMRVQPVAAREVGQVLAELAVRTPLRGRTELAGPEQHDLVDLARRLVAARGHGPRVVPVRAPGAAGTAMAGTGLLPGPGARSGRQTFAQWLAGTGARL